MCTAQILRHIIKKRKHLYKGFHCTQIRQQTCNHRPGSSSALEVHVQHAERPIKHSSAYLGRGQAGCWCVRARHLLQMQNWHRACQPASRTDVLQCGHSLGKQSRSHIHSLASSLSAAAVTLHVCEKHGPKTIAQVHARSDCSPTSAAAGVSIQFICCTSAYKVQTHLQWNVGNVASLRNVHRCAERADAGERCHVQNVRERCAIEARKLTVNSAHKERK